MANVNKTGFYPVGTLTGSPWNSSVRRFVANTLTCNICKGDLVSLSFDGKVNPVVGADSNIIGACVGFEPISKTTTSVQGASLSLEKQYIEKGATGTRYVQVVTDPFAVYETIVANGGTVNIVTANIGENYGILSTAGGQQSPSSKPVSPSTLDLGNPLGNAVGQLVLLEIVDRADNELTGANTAVRVVLNQSLLKAAKATSGTVN